MGGSEETDIDILIERIKEEKLNQSDYDWFLDLRKYGSVPHSVLVWVEKSSSLDMRIIAYKGTIPFARNYDKIKSLINDKI